MQNRISKLFTLSFGTNFLINQIEVRKTSFAYTLCLLNCNDNNDDNEANVTITNNLLINVSRGGRNKYAFLKSIFCCCFQCTLRVHVHGFNDWSRDFLYRIESSRDFTISMTSRDGNNKWWRPFHCSRSVETKSEHAHTKAHPWRWYISILVPFLFYSMLYVWTHIFFCHISRSSSTQLNQMLWSEEIIQKSTRKIWRKKFICCE